MAASLFFFSKRMTLHSFAVGVQSVMSTLEFIQHEPLVRSSFSRASSSHAGSSDPSHGDLYLLNACRYVVADEQQHNMTRHGEPQVGNYMFFDDNLSQDDQHIIKNFLLKELKEINPLDSQAIFSHQQEHLANLSVHTGDSCTGTQKLANILRYFDGDDSKALTWQSVLQNQARFKKPFSRVATCPSGSRPHFLCFFAYLLHISSGAGEKYESNLAVLGSAQPLPMIGRFMDKRKEPFSQRSLPDYYGVLIPYDGDDASDFPPIEVTQLLINMHIAIASPMKYGNCKAKVSINFSYLDEIHKVINPKSEYQASKGKNHQERESFKQNYKLQDDGIYYAPSKSESQQRRVPKSQRNEGLIVPMELWHILLIALHKQSNHGGRDAMRRVLVNLNLSGPDKQFMALWQVGCAKCRTGKHYGPRSEQGEVEKEAKESRKEARREARKEAKKESPQRTPRTRRARQGSDTTTPSAVGPQEKGRKKKKKKCNKAKASSVQATLASTVVAQTESENVASNSSEAVITANGALFQADFSFQPLQSFSHLGMSQPMLPPTQVPMYGVPAFPGQSWSSTWSSMGSGITPNQVFRTLGTLDQHPDPMYTSLPQPTGASISPAVFQNQLHAHTPGAQVLNLMQTQETHIDPVLLQNRFHAHTPGAQEPNQVQTQGIHIDQVFLPNRLNAHTSGAQEPYSMQTHVNPVLSSMSGIGQEPVRDNDVQPLAYNSGSFDHSITSGPHQLITTSEPQEHRHVAGYASTVESLDFLSEDIDWQNYSFNSEGQISVGNPVWSVPASGTLGMGMAQTLPNQVAGMDSGAVVQDALGTGMAQTLPNQVTGMGNGAVVQDASANGVGLESI